MKILGVTYKVGDRVRVKNIKDPGKKVQDRDLNGRIGHLVPKHKDIPFGIVGIILDPKKGDNRYEKINVKAGEFEAAANEK